MHFISIAFIALSARAYTHAENNVQWDAKQHLKKNFIVIIVVAAAAAVVVNAFSKLTICHIFFTPTMTSYRSFVSLKFSFWFTRTPFSVRPDFVLPMPFLLQMISISFLFLRKKQLAIW